MSLSFLTTPWVIGQDASTPILSSGEIVFRLTVLLFICSQRLPVFFNLSQYLPPLCRPPTLVSKIDDLGRARFALSEWTAILHLSATTGIHCNVSNTKTSRMADERLTPEPIPPLIAPTTLIFKGTLWRSGVAKALLSVLTLHLLRHLQILENYVGKHPVTVLTSFSDRLECEAPLVEVDIMSPTSPPQMYRMLFGRKGRKMHFGRPHRIPGNLEELVGLRRRRRSGL
ncbi:hypothetical protein B0H16DRAFT_1545545 [Mycena metata]|uniref:Uncharacterized protein n=1 Tax=Mycena metata TaxID=1033252 RepID=A0AAD7IYE6_9AGAR|nr:hypothetical protein B0H16DRAFT_1545545 [Mycena metata]